MQAARALLVFLVVAIAVAQDIPAFYDTRAQYPMCQPKVLNQGRCGSCWAFSTTTALSDRFCIASRADIATILSPQYLASCDSGNSGCGGGDTLLAYTFIQHNGNDNLNCTKYYSGDTGSTGPCPKTCDDQTTPISKSNLFFASKAYSLSTGNIKENVLAMQRDVLQYGPISASFLVKQEFIDFFKKNASGIYQTTYGGRILGGHAVKIIGWGHDSATGLDYWQLVNSWGTSWGDNGFFKMVRGVDDSNIESRKITAGIPVVSSMQPIVESEESTVLDGAFVPQTCDEDMLSIADSTIQRINIMNMMKNEAPMSLMNVAECATQVVNGVNYKFVTKVAKNANAAPEDLSVTVHIGHDDRLTVLKLE